MYYAYVVVKSLNKRYHTFMELNFVEIRMKNFEF